MKRTIDIERLLAWAFFELGKSGTSAWSPWDLIRAFGRMGTRVDDQFGSVFRLPAWFGDTHPDAKIVGWYVDALGPPATALVTTYAKQNSRPKPLEGPVRVFPVMDGSRYRVVGKSYGRASKGRWRYYYEGAYCPLRYVPTVEKLEASRAEYTAWHDGLVRLVSQLSGQLRDHVPTGPIAPAEPWINPAPPMRVLYSVRA